MPAKTQKSEAQKPTVADLSRAHAENMEQLKAELATMREMLIAAEKEKEESAKKEQEKIARSTTCKIHAHKSVPGVRSTVTDGDRFYHG